MNLYNLKSSGFLHLQNNSLPVFLCIGTRETWFKFHPGVSKQWHPPPHFPHLQAPAPSTMKTVLGGGIGKGCEPQRMAWLPQPSTCKCTSPTFSQQHLKLPASTPCPPHSLLPSLSRVFLPGHLTPSNILCWRRKWQPIPVFLPGKSQGQTSLVGCRLWDHRVGHNWSDLAAAAAAATYHVELPLWLRW